MSNVYIGTHMFQLTTYDSVSGAYTADTIDLGSYRVGDDATDTDLSDGSWGDGAEAFGAGEQLRYEEVSTGNDASAVYVGRIDSAPVFYSLSEAKYYVVTDDAGIAGTSGNASTSAYSYPVGENYVAPVGDVGHTHTGTAYDDSLTGAAGNDSLYGVDGADVLSGGNGNDLLEGGAGHDTLTGGTGNDNLIGNGGRDNIAGGDGNDTVYGGQLHDTIYGGAGDDSLRGEGGNDQLQGAGGVDYLSGGGGNDTLYGGGSGDEIYGAGGDDKLQGGAGDDLLAGGAGNDVVTGNGGKDWLLADIGNDTLSGGAGADVFGFVFSLVTSGVDTITDFDVAEDLININSGITTMTAGTLSASMLANGTAAGDGNDRFIYDGATGNLYYDADGTGATAQVQIAAFANLAVLTASDIVIV